MVDPSLTRPLSIPGSPELSATFDYLKAAGGKVERSRLRDALDIDEDALRKRLVRLKEALAEVYPMIELVIVPGKKGRRGRPGAVEVRGASLLTPGPPPWQYDGHEFALLSSGLSANPSATKSA